MKNIKIILSLLIISAFVFSGCASKPETVKDKANINASEEMKTIASVEPKSINKAEEIQLGFNLALLKELSANQKNVFYSSFSINQALSMVYFGAGGDTQEEIKNTLGYGDLSAEDIAAYQKYLLETYEDPGDTTFYSANSLWVDDAISLNDGYAVTMVDNFAAEVENIDLQGEDAVSTLNEWIDTKTKGMINKLYEQPFGADTSLVLMNAIYFKGQWTVPFNPDMTYESDFHGQNNESRVDMMAYSGSIMGYANDEYKAISMPYGDDERFQMVAVLPEGDINDFIQGLTAESFDSILTTFEEKEENLVSFPKFEMEEKVVLKETLKALGMPTAFTPNADFGQIANVPMSIDEVMHKAKIKVDEEGTEAAAVTGIIMKMEAVQEDLFEFVANRPFVYFIMDTQDNLVLFTGVAYDLEN